MALPDDVRIGVSLPHRSWPSGDVWPMARSIDHALRAERLGYDSVWCSDHAFFEGVDFGWGSDRVLASPEPMVVLAHIAGRTSQIMLGTSVLSARFRLPGQLAREARTLADVSGGRFILGVGAGWHGPELEAWGLVRGHDHSRLAEYLEVLVPLLDGERVDFDGTYYTARGAEVPGQTRPVLMVAASGPKSLALAARHADIWNGVGPERDELAAALDGLVLQAGRRPGDVRRATSITALLTGDADAQRLLARHPPLWAPPVIGVDRLVAAVEAAAAAGYEHVIVHLAPGPELSYDEADLERAAAALGLAPRS